jgi:CheY-like chemotaxis protein
MSDPEELRPQVLVIADELTHRSIVSRMVRTMGFRVRSCAGGPAALAFLRAHPREVKLVLSDLALRRMDGGELAERARDLDPQVKVVLMVGADDPHVDDLLAGYSYLPFVPKPVHFAELAEVLYDQLGRPEAAPADPPSMTRLPRRRGSGQHQEG